MTAKVRLNDTVGNLSLNQLSDLDSFIEESSWARDTRELVDQARACGFGLWVEWKSSIGVLTLDGRVLGLVDIIR